MRAVAALIVALAALWGCTRPVEPIPVAEAAIPRPELPDAAWRYERLLIRSALAEFGSDRYVSALAAQVEQESAWDCTARSRFADGCTQFTPTTASWFEEGPGRDLGKARPFDAAWALPAMSRYMAWIDKRIDDTASECDQWAMNLSAYNGGLGWVKRDRRLCVIDGCDPSRWWGHVENHSNRAAWAIKENRGYPRRILKTLTPKYVAGGYRGRRICTG